MVLHLWAQGLGEGDEHQPLLSLWSIVGSTFTFIAACRLHGRGYVMLVACLCVCVCERVSE